VRRGIVSRDRAIGADGQYRITLRQYGTHRHFAGGFRAARRLEGEPHEVDVATQGH